MTTLNLITIAVLVLVNGYFVAAEFALVSVRRERLHGGSQAARLVRRQRDKLDEYLSACQLGITIASLALGALGEPTLAGLLEPVLHSTPLAHFAAIVGSIGAILIMTTLHITVGEQAPKSFAIGSAEQVAKLCAIPLEIFHRSLRPLVLVLNAASNQIVRMLGGTPASSHAQQASLEELRLVIGGMAEGGHIDRSEHQLLEGVFALDEHTARDVMTPSTRLTTLRAGITVLEALAATRGGGHSRFPLLRVDGQLAGVVSRRDLTDAILDGKGDDPVDGFRNEMLVSPPGQVLEQLLRRMREARASIAAVVDEYGNLDGVVTIEDIVEEIVGEIYDEDDLPSEVRRLESGEFLVPGDMSLLDLAHLGFELTTGEAESVSGLIQKRLARNLVRGDTLTAGPASFRVLGAVGGRARQVLVWPAPANGNPAPNGRYRG